MDIYANVEGACLDRKGIPSFIQISDSHVQLRMNSVFIRCSKLDVELLEIP